jgi:plasmid stabilization system protein ParE
VRIAWTDLALDCVEESALHIAADDPVAARRWADELFAAVEQLARFPESGRLVPGLEGRRVRELIYGAYRVFYRVDEAVIILTVRHASQLIREDEVDEGRT